MREPDEREVRPEGPVVTADAQIAERVVGANEVGSLQDY
jgi:hypothetical protein